MTRGINTLNMPLDQLPTELLVLIARHSSPADTSALAHTTRRFHAILNPVLYRANIRSDTQTSFWWALQHAKLPTLRHAVDAGADLFQTTRIRDFRGSIVFRLVRDSWWSGPPAPREDIHAVVRFLVERGVDVSARNDKGDTPLERAMMYGNYELARSLIEFGADVHVVGSGGGSLLHQALRRDEVPLDILGMLMRKGLAVDCRDGLGCTPLHFAKEPEVVEFLIKNGADVNAQSHRGFTPLSRTIVYSIGRRWPDGRTLTKFKILLKNGAVLRLADHKGRTPLHYAARCEMLAFIKGLLREGADVHARDEHGHTPLHCATTENNRVDRIRLLLDSGADVHATDNEGKTPLFGMARLRKAGLEELIRHGGDVNARDAKGNTLLHTMVRMPLYKSTERDSIIPLLVDNGIDIGAKNNDSKTVFEVAEERGDKDLLEYLSPYRPHE